MNTTYIWIAVFALGLILELIDSGTLVSIWVSVGAVIPFVMSFYRTDAVWYIILQIVVFGLVTVLAILYLRKLAQKWLFRGKEEKTNFDINIGKVYKICLIEKDVPYIKINDVTYRVVDEEGQQFTMHDKVRFVRLEGNKAIVRKEKGD